ncbi:MAG TPA: peptide-methionine (S)-S-oxide reductase [Pseudohongiella sp.]|nr:peptide-methionine (S)-S-oxide reductase [Pseudohongiella sp.]MEC8859393.1 peptide-methionine (S)-S-oxide reductase MsrA [Pseudomonadota bacterium]HBX37412.1 peptide-methionine (S)-S-oxide reductase [Pseudohongiella sp.]|tara:strand:- start:1378 stop:2004 length:627 start_codon:yes stop_codon:yes gene_type:complete
MWFNDKTRMVTADAALPGRDKPLEISGRHTVTGNSMVPPLPDALEEAVFGLGCFWGAERVFWRQPGVFSTAVGYAGGFTPNPTYEEVCSGQTGHAEVVRVFFDPAKVSYEELLTLFWRSHNPTEGMRQGNDRGTQYRSAIYTVNDKQLEAAKASLDVAQQRLSAAGHDAITTEIRPLADFYYAEEYHQQYLDKNPAGYCGIRGLECLI